MPGKMSMKQLVNGVYGQDPEMCEPRIQEIVERIFLDPAGLVLGAVKGATLRPYTAADMKGVRLEETLGADAGMPHQYKLRLMNYEETGMAHGDYLMAMLEKYRATRDPLVCRRAKSAFAAIRQLADTVAADNPYGRGWWPKPYGGMNDLNEMFETSIDQTIKIVLALVQYDRELAEPAESRWCRMQVRAMADWWITHHFTTRYFGNCCWWDLLRAPHSAAALPCLVRQAMAWTPGRVPSRYDEAYEYLLGHQSWLFIQRGGLNSFNLAMECGQRLNELDPGRRRLWIRCRNSMLRWSVAATDPATGTNEVPGYGRYNTGLRAACTAATAFAWTGSSAAADFAWRLLQLYNRMDRFYHHDQADPPIHSNRVSCWFDALSGHHYAAWLLAYWRLKNGSNREAGIPRAMHLKTGGLKFRQWSSTGIR